MGVAYIHVLPVLLAVLTNVRADFDPNVTVTECSSSNVVIHTENATDGGIIYIQGRGPECKQATSAQSRDHSFNFDICRIELNIMFRLIVQERPNVQTGSDKVIPVLCIVDMGDIIVGNAILPHGDLDKGINKTTKPTAQMRILSDDSNDVSQGTVILSDALRMKLVLDDEFNEDFQISASECWASNIDLIKERCSQDDDLFPNFDRETDGSLVSNFKAFIPTNYAGKESVHVQYTCSLVVCQGSCEPTVCKEIVGWGKRKRRSLTEKDVDNITVGTTLRVISPHTEISLNTQDEEPLDESISINRDLLIILAALGSLALVFSWFVSCYFYQSLRAARGDTRNIKVARAVGRRLSSMLNIPSGYAVKDERMMHILPEEEGTPQRRRSVTVSTVSTQTEVVSFDGDNKTRNAFDFLVNRNKTSPEPFSNPEHSAYNNMAIASDNDDSQFDDDGSVSDSDNESNDVGIITNVDDLCSDTSGESEASVSENELSNKRVTNIDDICSNDPSVKNNTTGYPDNSVNSVTNIDDLWYNTQSSRKVNSFPEYIPPLVTNIDELSMPDKSKDEIPKNSNIIARGNKTILHIGFEGGLGGESDTDVNTGIKATNV